MANLLSWLGGVGAQLNPFDGGETFDSYMKKRKLQERQPAQQAQRPQMQPQQQNSNGMPSRTPSLPTIGTPRINQAQVSQNSVAKRTQPVFDPLQSARDAIGGIAKGVTDISRPVSQGGLNVLADASNGVGNFAKSVAKDPAGVGKGVVSGLQQAPAQVADLALMGGNVLEDTASRMRGGSSQERLNIYNKYGALRDKLKQGKTVTGESLIRQPDFQWTGNTGRDLGNLAGRSLGIATDATMFVNPTRAAIGGMVRTPVSQIAKNTAKDAALFGAIDGTQQGLETFGNTGNLARAVSAGTQAAGISALTQGVMGAGGYAVGRGTRNAGMAVDDAMNAHRAADIRAAADKQKIISIPARRLISYEGAPDRARVEQYKKQMQLGRPVEPLIIMKDKNNRFGVEDGKHRLQAYQELGIKNVPVKVVTPAGVKKIGQRGSIRFSSDPERSASYPGAQLSEVRGVVGEGRVMPTSNAPSGRPHMPSPTSSHPIQGAGATTEPSGINQPRVAKQELLQPIGHQSPQGMSLDSMRSPDHIPLVQSNQHTQNLLHPEVKPHTGQPEPQLLRQDNQRTPSDDSISQNEIAKYVKERATEQDKARKTQHDSPSEKVQTEVRNLKAQYVDEFAPIEDTLGGAIKNGASVATDNNIKYQLDRVARSEGIAQAHINDSGLARIIQNVPNTKEFDQYLIARHAKELDESITTGRNKAKDDALVKVLDGKYGDHAKELYKYNQELLYRAADYGLISKAFADQLKKRYPEYVPLNRIFSDLEQPKGVGAGSSKASVSTQKVTQKLKGSTREIESPLESIVKKTMTVIEQGEKNHAAKMLASYRDLPGNPFELEEIPSSQTIGNNYTISYLDDGVKRTFKTTKSISDAAKHMNKEQLGIVGQVLAAPARALRLGATGVNVGFTAANVVKDIVGAVVNSKHGIRSSPLNLVATGKALSAALHHNGERYQEMMREGVAGTSYDLARNAEPVNIKQIRSQRSLTDRAIYNMRPDRWVRTLENTIGRSEDFGRGLQYFGNKSAFEARGLSEKEATILAADQARFNSTNFHRAGSKGRLINAVVPYSNAAVQGARINLRRLQERPVATLAKIGMTIAMPSAAIALNNYGSEDKRKVMDRIPDYEKENNIVIVHEGAHMNDQGQWEGVTKIPVPPQFIGVHDSVQRAVKARFTGEEYDIVKSIGDITQALTTVNPTDANKTVGSYTPQAVKVAAEPLFNRNLFTGQEIVPKAMQNLEKERQVDRSTSGTAKVIGKLTNQSPLQIDNSINTTFAGAGQNVVNMTDKLLAASGIIKQDEVRGKNLWDSIQGRFVGAKGLTDGRLYFESFDKAAKENKLNGRDYEQLTAILAKETDAGGVQLPKDDKDKMTLNAILANSKALIKVKSDAAHILAKETGKDVDPLYKLSTEQQQVYYQTQGLPRGSAEQKHIKDANPWLNDLSKERGTYFEKIDLKQANAAGQVPYPEQNPETEALLNRFNSITDAKAKSEFMRQHPQISQAFDSFAKYTNDVRKAQGFDPLRTYQQASPRVQQLLDSGDKNAFKDAEVSQWMQNNSIYNLTKDAAMAQFQGTDLSAKSLKNMNSLSRYNLLKNPDGTFALKYRDTQGSGNSMIQAGATDAGARSYGKKGRKGSSGKSHVKLSRSLNKIKVPKVSKIGKKSPGAIKSPQFGKAITAKYAKKPIKKRPTTPKVAKI